MKTRAAVLHGPGRRFVIEELDLAPPRAGQVLIEFAAAGLCHSDLHLSDGVTVPRYPIVGGHEGAGIVEAVGDGVTKVRPGDHVVCSFVPSCGVCRYCSTGRQGLCDMAATTLQGCMPDGTFPFRSGDVEVGAMCMLGTFSERSVVSEHSVVKIDDWLPLQSAAIVGCGVPSGWGSAVNAGDLRPGDTAIIYGVGGLGVNAVQGAVAAGCKYVIVVDPVEFKRTAALDFGATHAYACADDAVGPLNELTWGQGADAALILTGVVESETVTAAVEAVGKGGTVVVTGLAARSDLNIRLSSADLTLQQKTVKGSMFGSMNPQTDIVRLLRMYDAGRLELDALITRRYTLDDINDGYRDLLEGKNIRGLIEFG